MPELPVIFLAFANPRRDLNKLVEREYQGIRSVLVEGEDKGRWRVRGGPNITPEEVIQAFDTYRDHVAIFHFGGHSDGYSLLLTSLKNTPEHADAEALAHLFGRHESLRLVFLNGCANQEQVQGLRKARVPAVIATSQAIRDDIAGDFAAYFYEGVGRMKRAMRRFMNSPCGSRTPCAGVSIFRKSQAKWF